MSKLDSVSKIVEEIFEEAEKGKVVIGDEKDGFWNFYTRFYWKENEITNAPNDKYPIFELADKKTFIKLLENYLESARKFYHADSDFFCLSGDNFDKKLLLDLFINATVSDFVDVNNYIKNKTEMLNINYNSDAFSLGKFQDLKIKGQITKNHSNLESPYKFDIFFEDETHNIFYLPTVFFATTDKKAYIMAIQNLHRGQTGKLAKKLDRFFRKTNKDIVPEDTISNVSTNALVSLTIFLSFLKKNNIFDITASCFQPIRYQAGKVAGLRQAKTQKDRQEFSQKHDRDQYNITNKFMYLFLRYNFHFPTTITDFDDNTQQMNVTLARNKNSNMDILSQIDNSIKITGSLEKEM